MENRCDVNGVNKGDSFRVEMYLLAIIPRIFYFVARDGTFFFVVVDLGALDKMFMGFPFKTWIFFSLVD